MIKEVYLEIINNFGFFGDLIVQHLEITMFSVLMATILGVGLGMLISRYQKVAGIIISGVNVAYTIPAIALLGFLIPFTGIGNVTAVVALTIYALLPMVRSTYVGLTSIDSAIIEAARAMGSRKRDILLKIRLPLAMPVICAALRNMITMTIALAGIASFVGAGGLGVAIYRGITTNNTALIIAGSFLIAVLALMVDGILALMEQMLFGRGEKQRNKIIAMGIGIILFSFSIGGWLHYNVKDEIEIASKPTTENYILAEIAGQLIEAKTGLKVHITHGIGGGTANIQPGMLKGEFDMYPEYTGTAWNIVLKEDKQYLGEDFPMLKQAYENKYGLTWQGMFGFNDTYGIAVRKEDAELYNLHTYSDLAKVSKNFIFGAEYDFFQREDGYPALQKAYGFNFAKVVDMDNGLKYQAIFNKQIQAMTVFTTDGQLSDPRLVLLEDNLKFYPEYKAGMVVRMDILEKYPQLKEVLGLLDNSIDEATMAKLNYQVEVGKENPAEVARKFLQSKGLIGGSHE